MKNRQPFKKRYILVIVLPLLFLFFGILSVRAECVLDDSALDGCKNYKKADCGIKKDDFSDKYCTWDSSNVCVLNDFVNEAYCNGESETSCKQEAVCSFLTDAGDPTTVNSANPNTSDKNVPKIVSLINPIAGNPNIQTIIGNVILNVMGILGALALLVFVYGGFKWLAAAGNEEHIKEGTQAMLWAVIGIFIIFGSYAIIKLIYTGLGVETDVASEKKIGCYCLVQERGELLVPSLSKKAQCLNASNTKDEEYGELLSCDFFE